MLRYVAFSCASCTTSSYVKISLPTWKVGKETQPWLKSTWSKVNNLWNTVVFRPGINFPVSTHWNCEIQSLKPFNLHMKWNMCTKGEKTQSAVRVFETTPGTPGKTAKNSGTVTAGVTLFSFFKTSLGFKTPFHPMFVTYIPSQN